MSIFKNLVNNVSFALSKKKMKELKSKQSQIKELNQQLICINSELKEKNEDIKTLNLEMLNASAYLGRGENPNNKLTPGMYWVTICQSSSFPVSIL